MKKIILLIVIFLLNSFSFAFILDFTGKVEKIYDGDTFRVNIGNFDMKIRVLGIDTPEIYYGQKVKSYKFYGCADKLKKWAERFLLNKNVKILKDLLAKNKGKYHRLLRYVKFPINYKGKQIYVDYGAAMILGFAKVYKRENFEEKSFYYKLQNQAQKLKRGIW